MAERKAILIVDDEPVNRFLLRGILENEYEILEAPNGRLAIKEIKENKDKLALVLLDIVMPAMDGFEAMETLRKTELLKNIPVMFVTAQYDDEKVKRGLALGVSEVIRKPFDPFEIQNRIKNVIELSRYEQESEEVLHLTKRNCILIADDVEMNRELLRMVFEGRHPVLTAEDGEQALSLVKRYQDRMALVMLDIVMPVMDGFQVIEELKKEPGIFEQIPVIFISAETNKRNVLRGMDVGVSEIIKKPFDPDVVRKRAENLINLFQMKNGSRH